MTSIQFHISGMRCASCVSHVEHGLKAVPGVAEAAVNLATEQAKVVYDPNKSDVTTLVQAVRSAGYEATLQQPLPVSPPNTQPPTAPTSHAEHHHHSDAAFQPSGGWPWHLIGGAILAVPIVLLGMGFHTQTSAWIQLALATPIQILLGWPFYRGAFKAARHGRADMDTLVVLGTTVAFVYSVTATVMGSMAVHHGVYFDTPVVILVLIGLGKWLEARARGSAAAAIRGLMDLQPAQATVLRDGQEHVLPVGEVRPGDLLLVRPGQRIPVDGSVVEGHSAVDQSLVTGESMPVEIGPGDAVIGGTINQAGALRFRATRTGKDMFLAQIAQLVEDAQASKAQIQRLADAVAGVFVPAVMVIALATLLTWGLSSRGGESWLTGMNAMVAVLIVACPCALGLATPTAIMVGTGLGARQGILIKDAAALERAGRLTCVVLDKTGTLTLGQPSVAVVEPVPGFGPAVGAQPNPGVGGRGRAAQRASAGSGHRRRSEIARAGAGAGMHVSEHHRRGSAGACGRSPGHRGPPRLAG